ncbi:MAG TPA: hypothetical protein VL461_12430 [Dictyobacter sp.]|nr:hypothetical protein [Dictyobacter sp.]
MITDTAKIKLTTGDENIGEQVFDQIQSYLDSSEHCKRYLLARDITTRRDYTLHIIWSSLYWRNQAWSQFSELLDTNGIDYQGTIRVRDENGEII